MSSREAVTVLCRGAPSRRRQWYAELARLIAGAPTPAAALFEGSTDRPVPLVTVRPSELIDTLRESLAGASVRIEERRAANSGAPVRFLHERTGYVVWSGEPGLRLPESGRTEVDHLGLSPRMVAGGWLGLQTFWLPARHGTLYLARRFRVAAGAAEDAERRFRALGPVVATDWSRRVGSPATFRPGGVGFAREWRRGGLRGIPREGWFESSSEAAARSTLTLEPMVVSGPERPVETPAIVFGASGAGKTTFLARWAARVVREGQGLLVLDLHGDLAPAVLGRLSPDARGRVVAVDATLPPVPGIAALVSDGSVDRSAAHLVAALKRLSPDGTDLYWGFRLERIFDTFVRLALESGGSLTDLYDLLTDPDRREAARLATRSVELARFLDELLPIVRRNPEFLWSAATRLSKVVLVPVLRELLAPEEGDLAVEELLTEGRALIVRLPFATLGPEAASFAATLVLGRIYLGLAARADRAGRSVPVSIVLDEVHALSPRLVAELLTEGRKFGLATVVATQYPDRLARELQSAARGALRGFVSFRVPHASAREVGAWVGLAPDEAVDLLPNLATGEGLRLDPRCDGISPTAPEGRPPPSDPARWAEAVDRTRREFGTAASNPPEDRSADDGSERLLLAVLASDEAGSVLRRDGVVPAAVALPGRGPDPALLSLRLGTLLRDGYLAETPEGLRVTAAGERRLGLTAPTEATRETAEHRALLMAAFRRFARLGYRLEILRQGRFDTTLPDARLLQLPGRESVPVPADLAAELERAQRGWAWRFFRGRDVYVEAEVSGALRSERVRHGVHKALRRGAFVLFVVGDAHRARRVRSVLRTMGLGVDRAQVWTLGLPAIVTDRSPGTNT